MVTVETVRRGAKLFVTAILLGTALALATAKPANATPVYSTCYGLGGGVGYYEWAVDEQGNQTDLIYIDECALDDLGAGPTDYEKVLEHESGHAAGLPHSSDTSDTMYPVLWIEGTQAALTVELAESHLQALLGAASQADALLKQK